jgi:hypothetical protein
MMEDHIRTGASTGQCKDAANAARGSRDQNGFSVQRLVHLMKILSS